MIYSRLRLLLLASFLVVFAPLQSISQVDQYADFQLIRDQAFSKSELREMAIELTDGIGPRLSGTQGFLNSVVWAKNRLQFMGVENARVETWGEFGNGWKMEKFYIAQTKPYYQPLVAVPQAWTGSTNGLVKAEVVMVNASSAQELEQYKGKLHGKVVITPYEKDLEVSFEPLASRFTDEDLAKQNEISQIRPDMDPFIRDRQRASRQRGLSANDLVEFCQSEGAIALISNSGSYGVVRSGGARNGRNLTELGLPVIDMTHEHYGRMVRLIDRETPVELELDIQNRLVTDDKMGYNVIGEIKGTNRKLKDEVVMIGAHIDSWHAGTGANDNGSGVIVMMEVMRILKQSGVKLDRTVRIALWGAEEQGLHGSRNWVKANIYDSETETKGPEYDKLSAYYNFDYGTGWVRGIFLQDNLALKPIFEEFLKPVHDLGAKAISTRNPGSSDHMAFNRLGIPGFALIQDRIDYGRGYHTNMDTFDRIQLADLKQAAVVVATLVYQTANHPEKLPRKKL
ncbi:M20/M25/M40 family metallo-hydrolase [Perlabentimonas gracilis]|uniref:M20/M25/M40 family metallo-hydrolase n=1 Tax=Perlabentimonas gracilis TaxID=2715279 RepID=UPI0014085B09|nr:M20/M25/M40 family metallo-hydrolase [Perlabentimonas gracilis]NHB68482.1 M20/M25/M40 family metallo-hydrolase [Perlabentimonas gracilis]